ELTYATDTNWTQLTTSQSYFDEHIAVDQADPKYITVTNTTSYRYYAFKFADNWADYAYYMAVRRIELQIGSVPTVTTQAATSIGSSSFTGNGTLVAIGSADVTERGICYVAGTTGDPTVGDTTIPETSSAFAVGVFSFSATELTAETGYRARAYATNSVGVGYGDTVQVTTLEAAEETVPSVTTQVTTNVGSNSFTANGTLVSTGGADVTERGICYVAGTSGDPTVANSIVSESSSAFAVEAFSFNSGVLVAATGYRVRPYAINSIGVGYGTTVQVTTLAAEFVPTVTTQISTNIASNSFTANGTLVDTGGLDVTTRGVACMVGTSGDPTIVNSIISETSSSFSAETFSFSIVGLNAETGYRVRIYAVNSAGVGYGETTQVTTLASTILTNVTLTHYSDGDLTGTTMGTFTQTGTKRIYQKRIPGSWQGVTHGFKSVVTGSSEPLVISGLYKITRRDT
ncbi:hypothetical protein IMZ68_04720, partial [Candidatus Bathyarchaeota archaeon]|nr:hypothetical protein [Candidatus Bathyarchaeota archaeon]